MIVTCIFSVSFCSIFSTKVIASDLPLSLVQRAAPHCLRLVDVTLHDRGDKEFWPQAVRCLKLLQHAPLKQIAVRGTWAQKKSRRVLYIVLYIDSTVDSLDSFGVVVV